MMTGGGNAHPTDAGSVSGALISSQEPRADKRRLDFRGLGPSTARVEEQLLFTKITGAATG